MPTSEKVSPSAVRAFCKGLREAARQSVERANCLDPDQRKFTLLEIEPMPTPGQLAADTPKLIALYQRANNQIASLQQAMQQQAQDLKAKQDEIDQLNAKLADANQVAQQFGATDGPAADQLHAIITKNAGEADAAGAGGDVASGDVGSGSAVEPVPVQGDEETVNMQISH